MKRLSIRLFLASALALTGGCVTNQTDNAASKALQTAKLDNELDVVLFESHKVPLVTIVLAVKAGAFTESPDTNGLTHLWEHMFFKGNAELPNQEAFNERIRELGIVYNGDTSAEKVRYYFTLPSAYLEEGIAFMYYAISSPLLEKQELAREIQVVLDEFDRNASQPSFELSRLRRRLIYGDKAYLRDPLGERHLIKQTTRKQLLDMKRDVFVPKNSALLLSGDFNPDEAKSIVSKYFSNWTNPESWQPPDNNTFPPFPKKGRLIATHPEARTPQLALTFQGPKAKQKPQATHAADVLISLLQLRSGKFYQKYVESGLCHYASLGYYTQSQSGEIHLSAAPRPQNILQVEKMLQDEPRLWLKPGYFTKQQLADVKRSLLISHQYQVNKPSEYVKTLAFWWAITGLDYYRNYLTDLQNVSMTDIREFIETYLIDKPHITSLLLAPQTAAKLKLQANLEAYREKLNNADQATTDKKGSK
jgi:zinc protease